MMKNMLLPCPYRNQINKLANLVKDIITAIKQLEEAVPNQLLIRPLQDKSCPGFPPLFLHPLKCG
jgi:hypothetical protein